MSAEDFGEDFGEATESRSRRGRRHKGAYRPGREVQGLSLRGQDGQVRNVPFPKKLATVEETNRGILNQEAARRAVEERLQRLEAKFNIQQKRDSAVIGAVTLAIGVPLTAIGAIEAEKAPQGGSSLGKWAALNQTGIAAVTSATQLVTTGAKLALNRRYHHSAIGIAADIFATLQLTAYAFGKIRIFEGDTSTRNLELIKTIDTQIRNNVVKNSLVT